MFLVEMNRFTFAFKVSEPDMSKATTFCAPLSEQDLLSEIAQYSMRTVKSR